MQQQLEQVWLRDFRKLNPQVVEKELKNQEFIHWEYQTESYLIRHCCCEYNNTLRTFSQLYGMEGSREIE